MKTAVIKRSLLINGKKTSVSLENEFWDALREIADQKNTTPAKLAGEIAHQRNTVNLSSAIRVYVYRYFRSIEGAQKGGSTRLDSASLRARAEESRALALKTKDEEPRAALLRIAADYEDMAAVSTQPDREQ
jgi:predicted DNA-binding ribbon-helix-helix protein